MNLYHFFRIQSHSKYKKSGDYQIKIIFKIFFNHLNTHPFKKILIHFQTWNANDYKGRGRGCPLAHSINLSINLNKERYNEYYTINITWRLMSTKEFFIFFKKESKWHSSFQFIIVVANLIRLQDLENLNFPSTSSLEI